MDIFVEDILGGFALCRLPDRDKNLIRLPLRELPKELRVGDVLTLRANGSLYLNRFAKETRMNDLTRALHYKKYRISGTK